MGEAVHVEDGHGTDNGQHAERGTDQHSHYKHDFKRGLVGSAERHEGHPPVVPRVEGQEVSLHLVFRRRARVFGESMGGLRVGH